MSKTYLITFLFSTVFAVYGQTNNSNFSSSWKNGFRTESVDGNFKLKFGGRLQNDWAFFNENSEMQNSTFGGAVNGTEFRRVRFYNSGLIYGNINYKVQFDYAKAGVVFKDVYIKLNKIPVVGNITVGHFNEPFSMEDLMEKTFSLIRI